MNKLIKICLIVMIRRRFRNGGKFRKYGKEEKIGPGKKFKGEPPYK